MTGVTLVLGDGVKWQSCLGCICSGTPCQKLFALMLTNGWHEKNSAQLPQLVRREPDGALGFGGARVPAGLSDFFLIINILLLRQIYFTILKNTSLAILKNTSSYKIGVSPHRFLVAFQLNRLHTMCRHALKCEPAYLVMSLCVSSAWPFWGTVSSSILSIIVPFLCKV